MRSSFVSAAYALTVAFAVWGLPSSSAKACGFGFGDGPIGRAMRPRTTSLVAGPHLAGRLAQRRRALYAGGQVAVVRTFESSGNLEFPGTVAAGVEARGHREREQFCPHDACASRFQSGGLFLGASYRGAYLELAAGLQGPNASRTWSARGGFAVVSFVALTAGISEVERSLALDLATRVNVPLAAGRRRERSQRALRN